VTEATEHLSSKCTVLNSNPRIKSRKGGEEGRERERERKKEREKERERE
jgi:hypothetical protein